MQAPDDIHTKNSKLLYSRIDSRFINKGDVDKCEKFKSELASQFKDDSGISSFCSRFTGILNYYGVFPSFDFVNKYRCKYFNLWIYESLSKLCDNVYDDKCIHIMRKTEEIWGNNNLDGKCKPEFISYMNDSNYEKMQKLYKFAVNYNIVQKYVGKGQYLCSEDQKTYIRDNLKLYELVKNECKSDTSSLHCVALKNFHDVYKEEELPKLYCKGEISVEDIRRETQESLSRTESNKHAHVGTLSSKDDPEQVEQLDYSDLPNVDGTSPIYNFHKTTAISFPILGILFIFFAAYKYTPAGTLLHGFLLGKKKFSHNKTEEGNHEFLEDTLNTMNENTNGSFHHVGYYPTSNI
ncbi:PIR Superfamily Protein [Plasmodium ovale wallikeri]|uniref:PIR Superfamily Protein n=1 Tax=Plasmodium ovale wallikeri TaxID=864142 RepID=A0A1A9A7B1_PLAOA|nr:PIR Superfamily Protein [Plasmodium ovale wallikeri]SBT55522.1 PIR Superfamily Protein [Plasmodium ovale wallikeri]